MKRSTLIVIVTAAIFISGLVLTVSSSASGEKKKETPSCCKFGTECGGKIKKSGSGELIMENMSRQFISI
ncbi:MAG: hypothetical protein U0U70_02260 [Chitinophagaceae bacterium]